jgi:nitroimidazol reductase NimA-like FMN-containing flavoprotein (pyridoxamine 5'-phosphate oxidase superfamily)
MPDSTFDSISAHSPADLPLAAELERSPRTRIRRYAQLQSYDRAALNQLLDEALIAHVGFHRRDDDGAGPVGVIPMGYARDGDSLLLHGSTRAGITRAGTSSTPLTATVTLLDGLVYAATLYDSTFNFRSAVISGGAVEITNRAEKIAALQVLSERIMPGRWPYVPELTAHQLAATAVMRLPFDVVSLKIRIGAPDDAPPGELWTGVLPLAVAAGDPQPQPGATQPVPDYVADLVRPHQVVTGD